jgi:hypothetical protein
MAAEGRLRQLRPNVGGERQRGGAEQEGADRGDSGCASEAVAGGEVGVATRHARQTQPVVHEQRSATRIDSVSTPWSRQASMSLGAWPRAARSAATSAAGQLAPSPGTVEPYQHDCPPRISVSRGPGTPSHRNGTLRPGRRPAHSNTPVPAAQATPAMQPPRRSGRAWPPLQRVTRSPARNPPGPSRSPLQVTHSSHEMLVRACSIGQAL